MMILVLMFAALLSFSDGASCGGSAGGVVRQGGKGSNSSSSSGSSGPRYLGCYLDDAYRMINDKFETGLNALTHEWCFDYCSPDYKYAGLQNSAQCFCGNSIDTTKYPQKPDDECDKACKGDAEQMCGGFYRNSLYQLY